MMTQIEEAVLKSSRRDFKTGGHRITENIKRVITNKRFALLECGHWCEEVIGYRDIRDRESLDCHICEDKARWTQDELAGREKWNNAAKESREAGLPKWVTVKPYEKDITDSSEEK